MPDKQGDREMLVAGQRGFGAEQRTPNSGSRLGTGAARGASSSSCWADAISARDAQISRKTSWSR